MTSGLVRVISTWLATTARNLKTYLHDGPHRASTSAHIKVIVHAMLQSLLVLQFRSEASVGRSVKYFHCTVWFVRFDFGCAFLWRCACWIRRQSGSIMHALLHQIMCPFDTSMSSCIEFPYLLGFSRLSRHPILFTLNSEPTVPTIFSLRPVLRHASLSLSSLPL